MMTNFHPQHFSKALDNIFEQLKILVASQQYQQLSNSEYYANVDYTLIDAVQALEQANDAFMEFDAVQAQQEFQSVIATETPKE